MDRRRAAELGRETIEILGRGYYEIDGVRVMVADLATAAIRNTQAYPPDSSFPTITPGNRHTQITVENTTTLAVAQRLAQDGRRVAALNFASAMNPGGGFLGGSRAQEESLARSSALYACLKDREMYVYHRKQRDPMYSNYAIYSPDVPVFRTDEGTLLETPYLCSFITSPAVNAKVVLQRDHSAQTKIRAAMQERTEKVLTIAAHQQHHTIVLGAWGCGVFGNDSAEIARIFDEALSSYASGVFETVVFAITDWSKKRKFIGPFQDQFAQQNV